MANAVLPPGDPVWDRLEDQIGWYERRSRGAQRAYRWVKLFELLVATTVPPLAALKANPVLVASLGSVVVLIEGLQHLYQYQERWIGYRSTCERLKRERHLFLGNAEPYASAPDPRAMLAEQVEQVIGQEITTWATTRRRSEGGAKDDDG
jgi:hypothetical protein